MERKNIKELSSEKTLLPTLLVVALQKTNYLSLMIHLMLILNLKMKVLVGVKISSALTKNLTGLNVYAAENGFTKPVLLIETYAGLVAGQFWEQSKN